MRFSKTKKSSRDNSPFLFLSAKVNSFKKDEEEEG